MTDMNWLTVNGTVISQPIHNVNEKKGMATYYVPWPCGRCGGAGGSQAWAFTGYTCYECGGHGHRSRVKALKAYTADTHAKLVASREKRAAIKATKNAVIAAERAKAAAVRYTAWRADHVALTAAVDAYTGANMFIIELRDRLIEYGVLSDKQVTALESVLAREAVKAIALDCPSGRVRVEGEIVTLRTQEGQFGVTLKMLLMAKEGYKVWLTAPRALVNPEKGMQVVVTVTVEPSASDKKFGFGKRPVLEVA
jgi:hypothetical protein